MSMSLYNELRQPFNNQTLFRESYNWQDWYTYIRQGADAIHQANPDVLVFLSGLNSDTELGTVVQGSSLAPGTATFNRDDFDDYADKLVLELHMYENIFGPGPSDCSVVQKQLFDEGFQALTDSAANRFPVLLTEFGFVQNQTLPQDPYASCLMDYLTEQNAGWMIWVLAGSYYIREGEQDYDEPWGLLTHDWSGWRAPEYIENSLIPMANTTLTELSKEPGAGGSDDGNSGESLARRMSDVHGKGPLAFLFFTGVLIGLFVLT